MKILHVVPSIATSYGGPTQSLAGYVRASHLCGDEVHVASPRGSVPETEALSDAGASRVITFASMSSGSSAMSPALVTWLKRNAGSYDVAHVHGLFNFISTFSARAALGVGLPLVIRPFGTLSRYTFSHRRAAVKRLWFDALETPNLNGAAAIHFTTSAERDEADWHGLSLGSKAHVVPPPFLPSTAPTDRSAAGANNVLFLGRMHPVKNLESLVEAWSSVVTAFPGARLVIAGGGDRRYAERIRALAQARGQSGTISFPGFLAGEAKAQAFANASLFVLPSLHENFGIVLLEALASGVPVVVSEEVQLKDFVTEGSLGLVCHGDAKSLANAIVAALADEGLKSRVAADGMRLVESRYSAHAVGTALSSMYLAAVNNRQNSKAKTFS
jgi:glycosyltransferase involved in cell wall biosynthesis